MRAILRVTGGRAEGSLGRADQQRVRHGRSSFLPSGIGRCRRNRRRRMAAAAQALNDHVALHAALLADTGMTVAREDLALEAAFWAQLPGNFPVRPRKAPITSRNFAAMAPFHNYPYRPRDRESLGRRLERVHHQRTFAVLLLASCERSGGSGRRQPQRYRAHAYLRAHRLRQDGVHRLFDCDAGAAGRDPSHLRQGSRA